MTDTTITDSLSAYLDGVRERADFAGAGGSMPPTAAARALADSAEDVRPLLAAVEAVLKVAAELCKDTPCSSALDEDRMWGRQEHGRQIIRAISSELTGTGGNEASGG